MQADPHILRATGELNRVIRGLQRMQTEIDLVLMRLEELQHLLPTGLEGEGGVPPSTEGITPPSSPSEKHQWPPTAAEVMEREG